MKSFVVAKRIIKQIIGDKRSLALMFLAPVFVLYLLYEILTSSAVSPIIDVVNAPQEMVNMLEEHAQVQSFTSKEEVIERIEESQSDAYLFWAEGQRFPEVMLEGTDPTLSSAIPRILQQTFAQYLADQAPGNLQTLDMPSLTIHYYYGSEDLSTFDSLAPRLMTFFIFFFVFILAGISFLRERISGTLDRILATPLKRYEIVFGYFIGFGIFVAIQTLIIQGFMVYGIGVPMEGSFFSVLWINILTASVALSLGTFLSAYARSEFQLFQFVPLVIAPQILFSGIFDLSEAPMWIQWLSVIFPLSYSGNAAVDIMLRGTGLVQLSIEWLILIGYSLLFLSLNISALKKYRSL